MVSKIRRTAACSMELVAQTAAGALSHSICHSYVKVYTLYLSIPALCHAGHTVQSTQLKINQILNVDTAICVQRGCKVQISI